jgi:hypothetical protein
MRYRWTGLVQGIPTLHKIWTPWPVCDLQGIIFKQTPLSNGVFLSLKSLSESFPTEQTVLTSDLLTLSVDPGVEVKSQDKNTARFHPWLYTV